MSPTNVYKILAVFFVLSLIGIGTSNAFGQAGSPSANNPERISDTEVTQQVLAVDEARRLAMLHSDVSVLDSLLSDDVTIFWGDGTADDKASTLALFRSGRFRYAQLDYENTIARLYGEIAVLTGQARVKEQSDKESRSYIVRVTRVYVRRQGGGASSPARQPEWHPCEMVLFKPRTRSPQPIRGDDALTPAEISVLRLIAAGNANKQIADQLSITEETVKGCVKNILSKLGANDRTHAAMIGLKRGIIEL